MSSVFARRGRPWRRWLCCAALLALAPAFAAAQQPTGLRPPTKEEQEWAERNVRQITRPKTARPESLPAAVKNIQFLPQVDRQVFGSCACWSSVYYYKTFQEAREHGWTRPDIATHPERVMSPDFVYNLINAGEDAGSSLNGAFQTLVKHGAAPWASMPSNVNFYNWPTEAQWRAGIPYRARSAATIAANTDPGIAALKEHLAGGDLAVFAMVLPANFASGYPSDGPGVSNAVLYANAGGVYVPPGTFSANHALTVIGYDDNRTYVDASATTRTGAFLVVNSWGTSWGWLDPDAGTRGFIWLSYDYFKSFTDGVAWIMEDRIGYAPSHFAVFELTHGRALEASVYILGGPLDAPDWEFDCFPRSGGDRELTARVVADLTDFASSGSLTYWMQAGDFDIPLFQPPKTGRVTYFAIERPGAAPWVSTDAPMETVEVNIALRYATLHVGLLEDQGPVFGGVETGQGSHLWGDLDNDGDPDLVFAGWTGSQRVAKVFRNDGADGFSEIDGGLPGVSNARLALGDYDGDGYLDLALNGYDDTGASVARIFRNVGGGVFADSGIALPAVQGQFAWVDFDDDGDLDLSFYEPANFLPDTTLLTLRRNNGDGSFSEPVVSLAAPVFGDAAWADFNRDGWIDVAITGSARIDGFSENITFIYANNGGVFVQQPSLPGAPRGFAAWGDADNDGWLDLALLTDESFPSVYRTRVYRNTGDGMFAPYAALPGLTAGSAAWGDMDNDGLPDLAVSGDALINGVADVVKHTRVYRNLGGGAFQDLGARTIGVGDLMSPLMDLVQWVDVDGDGDLDLSVCGDQAKPYPLPKTMRLYENRAAQRAGLNRPNQPPIAPLGLLAAQPAPGGPVWLNWNPGVDAETPANGLYYNLRAGSNPGWNDIVSGAIASPLMGARVRPSLAPWQLGVMLNPPPPGPVFWSVQSIDAGLRASPWSASQLFAPSGAPPGDVDGSGQLDVRDFLKAQRMANGQEVPDPARADRNGDGRVDLVDAALIKSMLLAEAGPGQDVVSWKRIDAAGGALEADGFLLVVPPGAFDGPAELMLRRSDEDRPFGSPAVGGASVSPTFRLSGAPDAWRQPLTVRLRADAGGAAATRPETASVRAVLGDTVFVGSLGRNKRAFHMLPAAPVGGGVYEFTLPATDPLGGSAEAETIDRTEQAGGPAGYRHSWELGLLGGYNSYAGAHFSIEYPSGVSPTDVENLATYLEEAYADLSDAGTYNFSYAARTRWPISVTVRQLDPDVYGYSVNSRLGNNYGHMEFNSLRIAAAADVRVTAGHEFFHFVQSLYDPRNRVSKATFPPRHYWLDEAASVWSEALFSADPDYISDVYNVNKYSPFDGMHKEGASVGPHGYGMAALVQYLIGRQGPGYLRNVYNDIAAGRHPVHAVFANSPDLLPMFWYDDFFGDLLLGQIYDWTVGDLLTLTPASRRWTIQSQTDIENIKRIFSTAPDLGAVTFMVTPNFATLPDDAAFYAKLVGEDMASLALKFKTGERQFLVKGAYMGDNVTKLEAPNLKQAQTEGYRLLLAAISERSNYPYTKDQPIMVELGVVTERTLNYTPSTVNSGAIYDNVFPLFDCGGSLTGAGIVGVEDHGSGLVHLVFADAIGALERTYQLNYTAVPQQTTYTTPPDEAGWYDVHTFGGVETYKLELYNSSSPDPTISYSPDGHFSFDLQPVHSWTQANLIIVYDVTIDRYDGEDQLIWTDVDEDQETPVHILVLIQ